MTELDKFTRDVRRDGCDPADLRLVEVEIDTCAGTTLSEDVHKIAFVGGGELHYW